MNTLFKVPLHHRPKKTAVGIYIGPESVEIVQTSRTRKGILFSKTVSREISKKNVTPETIRELFLNEDIKETAVTATIPEESVMLRRFVMPLIPQKQRNAAVRFEAKRHIPFNIEEIISGYYIIREDRIRNTMDVLFVAAKKDDVDSVLILLQNAGLIVEKIEPASLALIKTLILTGNLAESSPPVAILHFFSKTDGQVIIVENGIPYLKREISFTSKEFKLEEQVLNEIRLSLSYYKREFSEKNIAKVIITGLREVPLWTDTLKSGLGIPVEHVLPLKKIADINLPNRQLEIPVGLAVSRLEKTKMDFNLLPEELIPVKYNISKIAGVSTAVVLCAITLVYLQQMPTIRRLKKELDSAETRKVSVPELALSAKSIDELRTLRTTLQQKKDILSVCIKNRVSWHTKLRELIKTMPGEIWIKQLTIGDSIGIPGARLLILRGSTYAQDPTLEIEITNNFANALKNNSVFMDGFKRLTLGTITKTNVANYEVANFDISLTTD